MRRPQCEVIVQIGSLSSRGEAGGGNRLVIRPGRCSPFETQRSVSARVVPLHADRLTAHSKRHVLRFHRPHGMWSAIVVNDQLVVEPQRGTVIAAETKTIPASRRDIEHAAQFDDTNVVAAST